ncbi:MAG TPA: DUF1330 domain-containing protein [Solirubrobacteraceae bacterium]|nr:DUF1330 domain-containing protein [Solirubrobacteraceae bacterium]
MNAVEPTPHQLVALQGAADDGPVVMLNLLRFHERAVGIDASDGITGAEAYGRYGAGVTAFLARAGGEVLLALRPEASVIGPEASEWDLVLAVRYPSRAAFMAMITDPEYLAVHQHRTAGVVDSRLIACAALTA